MLDAEEIVELFEQTRVDPAWSFADCGRRETTKLSHGYHRYPAKFIPQVVERLFDVYLDGQPTPHVNDLFMGSGTTIACAIARGCRASGTDINHAAALITRAKATPIDPAYLAERVQTVDMDLLALEDTLPLWPPSQELRCLVPQENLERIDYWFDEETRDELGFILGRITAESDPRVRCFLSCCFSHILKTVSRWSMGSTKPTRDRRKRPRRPIVAFRQHLKRMMRGNRALWKHVPLAVRADPDAYLNIQRGDARQQPVEDASVDLQVTSSPYVTSYEYADLHQLTTLWLAPEEDLREYRRQFIGTSARRCVAEEAPVAGRIAHRIAQEMEAQDSRVAAEIRAYFADMQACFQETARILKPGARCCYVIGNTTLKGVDILNAQAFAEGLQLAGLELEHVVKREIPVKILPTVRDAATGRFASCDEADARAYPTEFIVVGRKTDSKLQTPNSKSQN